jgi:ribonuclease HI
MPPKPTQRSILLVVSGVCQGSPGPGGWGYVACFPTGLEQEGQGGTDETTADRMEITAVIEGLKSLGGKDRGTPVRVVSASSYLVDGAKGGRDRSANTDLWAKLDAQTTNRSVVWEWEPPNTMLFQSQAYDLARRALKRALKPPEGGAQGSP